MAPNLSWLSSCKSAQLKALAIAVGINSGGTKPLLTSQLLEHLPTGYLNRDKSKNDTQQPYKIISIDMGIRNLAYCRLILPQSIAAVKTKIPASMENPMIIEWARLEISKKATSSNLVDTGEPKAVVKETFDPATYSQHAYDLVRSLLAEGPSQPTHILIERQRFRSMGGSAVQEWTLRVNMFEAMIYAVLKAFSESGQWKGTVFPIAPAKVSKFWLGRGDYVDEKVEGVRKGRASNAEKTKSAKIAVVERWLSEENGDGRRFGLEGQAKELGRAYLRKRKGGKRVTVQEMAVNRDRKAIVPVEIGKLDDLADCLLQGMAWIQWEKNRRLIMVKGLEALDELGNERK